MRRKTPQQKNCGNLQKLRQFAGHGQNCKLAAKHENREKNCSPQDCNFLPGLFSGILLTDMMRITERLTEVLAGGCCCEAVVGVLLLDDWTSETVADTGTCATLICKDTSQHDRQTANKLTVITPHTALSWPVHVINKSGIRHFPIHFVDMRCHLPLEILLPQTTTDIATLTGSLGSCLTGYIFESLLKTFEDNGNKKTRKQQSTWMTLQNLLTCP